MQQTSKYQFNLVDAADDFSPDPLNQNAQKMEDALEAHAAAVAEQLGAVEDSVAALAASVGSHGKNARISFGTYTGSGQSGQSHPNTLTADFVPVAALVVGDRDGGSKSSAFLVRGCTYYEVVYSGSQGIHVSWQNNSLSWYGDNVGSQLNDPSITYAYLLIGYDQAGNT